ncbi:hypothetical protein AAG570_000274 [Ranatra chinensis]|uniref:Ubiquitin conjugation factor E4 A n=1 Tax=Ranatra chinensis TaxID=642074 RepID=A0ABD0YWM2_9HEMI
MSGEQLNSNPFFGLITPSEHEVQPISSQVHEEDERVLVNRIAENVFRVTIDEESAAGSPYQLVYLEDVAASVAPNKLIDLYTLKAAIFERILLAVPSQYVVEKRGKTPVAVDSHSVQNASMLYLFECYQRLKLSNLSSNIEKQIVGYIIENACTALREPVLFEHNDIHEQVINLFGIEESDRGQLIQFLVAVVNSILAEDGKEELKAAFNPILSIIQRSFSKAMVITFSRLHFCVLNFFANNLPLAEVLVDYIMPNNPFVGLSYSDTLLGAMLNLSCLPKFVEGNVEYFEKPLDGALSALEGNLWTASSDLCDHITTLIEQLIRGSGKSDLRLRVLTWFGRCLDSNLPRGRLWATTNLGVPGAVGFISDGFAINMASVLLRLCKPFITPGMDSISKILKIDPTYPAASVSQVSDGEMDERGVHCRSLHNETCLQPVEEGDEPRPVASQPFSFMTELFHVTHRALDLSVRVLLERTQQLYQEIGRLQQTLSDAQAQVQPRPDVIEVFRERMEMEMSRYLCMRCALLEPTMLKLLGQFEVSTTIWIVQVILDPTTSAPPLIDNLPTSKLRFPLPEFSPATLKCVPELIVESVGRYLRLAKTYSPQSLEEGGADGLLEPLLTALLVLMGSNSRARNPHLRAHLAQCLECLLPRDQDQPSLNPNPLGVFYREKLFLEHPHRAQIVESLLNVFVSIEMTGQSVAFEQKFNYRRPMYTVMDYLWGIPEHRAVFKRLSSEAEANMEEVTPPLFLRFLNLLMNDAVFLLDEALANMAQLRQQQTARDNGEWNELSPEERDRNEQYFRQVGMTARFDNILGKETIHTLEYMSSEIKSIFCHSTMVDRIAAMLNYFLYHLVGPKKKNFKVKDKNEYKFEPGGIVLDICRIYIHLGMSSDEFCAAVSRDGRSYSPQLFGLTRDVLARIGGVDLLADLDIISKRVEKLATQQQTDEELLAEAPEEFLDPIMSTLMSDPVVLPSSRITIDRSTIARHLLSDQTDPFNRSPLSMNMVQSNTELKKTIEAWVAERRSQAQKR